MFRVVVLDYKPQNTNYNDPVNVYISVDFEGITGLVSWAQCGTPSSEHYDFAFARRMLNHDVNAAIRGAREAGAKRIVVKDSHNMGKNLLIDELEDGVELISGYGSGRDGMMEGVEPDFGAAVLVGYHATCGTAHGVLEHALAGGLHRFWINGDLAGEIAASAAVAGAYGVPLVCVTSDDLGCAETSALIPGCETYSVKSGIGKVMARLKHPSETKRGIEEAVRKGISKATGAKPYVVPGPVTMRFEFHTADLADMPSLLEGVRRLDGYTLELERPTFLEAHTAAYAVFLLSAHSRHSGD